MARVRDMAGRLLSLLALSVCVCIQLAPSVAAQAIDVSSAPTPEPLTRSAWHFDLAASVGDIKVDLQPGRYPTYAPGFHPTPATWSEQVTVGVWRKRLKTEIEFGRLAARSRQNDRQTTGIRADVYERVTIATRDATTSVSLLHNYQVRRFAVAEFLQFRPGTRLRPYVGLALGLDRESHWDNRLDTVAPPMTDAERLAAIQSGNALAADPYPATFPTTTTTHVHAALRAGAKAYVLFRHVFLQFEGVAGTRSGPVRIGVGIDIP